MTNTQKDSTELKQIRALIDAAVENGTELALQTAALAIVQLIEAREREAEKRLLDKIFELSPTKNFEHWRPQDALKFYERLKALEQHLQPKPQAGEGGES